MKPEKHTKIAGANEHINLSYESSETQLEGLKNCIFCFPKLYFNAVDHLFSLTLFS